MSNEINMSPKDSVGDQSNQEIPVKKSSRKKWIICIILTVVLITGVAGISVAQKFKHMRDDGPLGILISKIADDLDLNAQQKTTVENIKKEIKDKMESRKQTREDRFGEFETLFKSDNLDKTQLDAAFKKHEADREEMRGFFEDELIKFHDVLTSSQRTKAVEKLKDLREKFKDGKEGPFDRKDGKHFDNQ